MGFDEQKKIFPVYLLSGPENLLKEEFIEYIKNKVLKNEKEIATNYHNFYSDEIQAGEIISLLQNLSFFSSRIMVVINECDKLKNFDLLIDYIEKPVMENILILVTDKISLSKKVENAINKSGITKKFWHLFENQIPGWITERVSLYQKYISNSEAKYLLEKVGNNIMDIRNEINKLVIFIGDREAIKKEDIDSVVSSYYNVEINAFLKLIIIKNIEKALELFAKLLYRGIAVQRIIGSMLNHLNTILCIKELKIKNLNSQQIINKLSITKFKYRIYSEQESLVSLNEIMALIKFTNRFDVITKSGSEMHQAHFENILFSMFGGKLKK